MDKYDAAFLGILQNEGKLPNFLDAVFSFLSRRTDFYLHMRHDKDTMGFPPGVAKKIVLAAYQKYENQYKEKNEMRLREYQMSQAKAKTKEHSEKTPAKPEATEAQAPKTTQEEPMDAAPSDSTTKTDSQPSVSSEKKQTTSSGDNQKNTNYSGGDQPHEAAPQESSANSQKVVESGCKSGGDTTSAASSPVCDGQKPAESKDSQANGTTKPKEADEDDPELTRQQKEFQKDDESYNGARRDNYRWSQTITEVDARVQIPKYIRRGKEVQVDIQKKHLKVVHKDKDGGWTTVVDDDLTWEVHKDECIWSLIPGEHVHVNLEKVQERWWEALLESEPRISVRKIDASRPMTDLDDEAQAKIEEMMYNENQKRLGKPQSHEKKVHSMLEKAWDAEGSPFQGQPFDPSKLNISSAGTDGSSSIDFSKMGPPST